MAQRILSRAGYAVLEAGLPSEAVELCRRHSASIDVLLTDVVMPEMSGPDLASRITALRPGTRVMYASGYPGDFLTSKEGWIREVAFVQKPFTKERLLEAVRQALDNPGWTR